MTSYARLLQVTAGQFLQQFFNPYYGSSTPASPAQSNSPSNPLANGLLPPGGASLGGLVQQLVASRAQPPASEPVTAQQPASTQSPAPSPVSTPPALAAPLPVPALSPADLPAADMSVLSQPPSIAPVAEPLVTAANGPSASAAPDSPQLSVNTLAVAPAVALPELPVTGLAGASGSVLGQGSLLPAEISALATAAVLADQVRPQVNNLAGILSDEAGTALSDSPIGGLLQSSGLSGLLPNLQAATPPPPASFSTLIAGLLPPGSPPAPPPVSSLLDLPEALGNTGSLINATVTGLTDNVR